MRPLKLIILAAVASLVATAAVAQHKRSFENLWGEATAAGQHTLTDYGDYTMVDRGDVFWYFTKPGHDAYPGVVRRAIKQNNGRFFIDTQGWSFAAEAGQPGFKRWLAHFETLNRRLIEALGQQPP